MFPEEVLDLNQDKYVRMVKSAVDMDHGIQKQQAVSVLMAILVSVALIAVTLVQIA